MTTQLDLFGQVAAELDDRYERAEAAALYRSRFQRAWWVAPWDCADGTPKGTMILGWVCPDCHTVETSCFLLNLNHGYHPDFPEWEGWCRRSDATRPATQWTARNPHGYRSGRGWRYEPPFRRMRPRPAVAP